jgi:hypothetical protein
MVLFISSWFCDESKLTVCINILGGMLAFIKGTPPMFIPIEFMGVARHDDGPRKPTR